MQGVETEGAKAPDKEVLVHESPGAQPLERAFGIERQPSVGGDFRGELLEFAEMGVSRVPVIRESNVLIHASPVPARIFIEQPLTVSAPLELKNRERRLLCALMRQGQAGRKNRVRKSRRLADQHP